MPWFYLGEKRRERKRFFLYLDKYKYDIYFCGKYENKWTGKFNLKCRTVRVVLHVCI